jgi:transposase
MRPEGSGAVLEARRRLAVRILNGKQPRGVLAGLVGVHRCTLWRWQRAAQQGGAAALAARSHPGPRPRLSLRQRRRLAQLLRQDPTEHGWPTSLWTARRVAELIQRHFGVRYHPGHVRRLLRLIGLSHQKPQRYARERDEAAIAHWRRYRWPALKKRPAESAVGQYS